MFAVLHGVDVDVEEVRLEKVARVRALRLSRASSSDSALHAKRVGALLLHREQEKQGKKEKRPEQDLNLRRQSLIDGELIRVYPLNRSGIWPLACSPESVYKYKAR